VFEGGMVAVAEDDGAEVVLEVGFVVEAFPFEGVFVFFDVVVMIVLNRILITSRDI
jgi:hypothetical protein